MYSKVCFKKLDEVKPHPKGRTAILPTFLNAFEI